MLLVARPHRSCFGSGKRLHRIAKGANRVLALVKRQFLLFIDSRD